MTSKTTTTDQVSINMENINNANKLMDSLTTESVSVDELHSNRTAGHRRHNSHGSNGSGHRNHSGESDLQHRHHQHRERRRSRSRSHSPSRRKRSTLDLMVPPTEKDVKTNSHDVEPLLETEVHRKFKQTELDEDSDDSVTDTQHEDNSGVDDGFFVGERSDTGNDSDHKHNVLNNNTPNQPNGEKDLRPFPTLPPSFGGPNIILDAEGNPRVIPDINVYQQKKNLAQGMMDLALLSANANQLRYVLETYVRHPYFWFSFVFIILSLILQVAVGVGLILNSRYNVKNKDQICRADKINNFTILGIFLITTVNVFIAAFGVADPPASA